MMVNFNLGIPTHYRNLVSIYEGMDIEHKLEDELNVEVPEGERVIDEYWIVPGFCKVQIIENEDNARKRYNLIEPPVGVDELQLLNIIYNDMKRTLVLKEYSMDKEKKTEIIMEVLNELIEEYAIEMHPQLLLKTLYYLFRNFIGFGPIDGMLNDPYLEDVSCDGYDIPVYVFHVRHGSMPTNVRFSKDYLDNYVLLLCQKAGKYISYANPLVDATLPDGSRLQATYGSEITPRGSSFTIRKFRATPYTPVDLLETGTMNATMLAYFWLLVENKMNIMVVGETAAGKTTTLNALMMFIPPDSKVISIEDTREIHLIHDNWIAEVTRLSIEGQEITMYDLLRAALRQRPDYIIVGEVRGREALTLFQAMSTGHAAYATLHAGDINQLVYRLENEPLNVPRIMIQFLDAVVVQSVWARRGVRKRRAIEVNEIFGIDPVNKNLLVNPLFKWDPSIDAFTQTSESKKLDKIARIMGVDTYEVVEELARRAEFLEALKERGIRDFSEVIEHIQSYYTNPEKTLQEVRS
ncbi:MAG: secretion system protein E [Archaeoglobales archaeon]|nr:MAG: secretion system protein E [Archaeoglobales archaeon]